ncbi:MAG: DUF4340 domain-containing protein [bacterium]
MKLKIIYTLLISLGILIVIVLLLEGPLQKQYKNRIKIEKSFANFNKNEIAKIEIYQNDEKKIILVKKEKKWQILSYKNFPASEEKINQLLLKVENFKNSEIISFNPKKQLLFEVDKQNSNCIAFWNIKNNLITSFYIGKMDPIYNKTYIRSDNSNEILLAKDYIEKASIENKDWLEKKLFKFKSCDIVKLKLKTSKSEIEIIKNNEIWEIIKPYKLPGLKNVIENICNSLEYLEVNDYVEKNSLDLEKYGLNKPFFSISVDFSNGEKEVLLVGKLEKTDYYVKKYDSEDIYKCSKMSIDEMQKKLDDLIEKR